MTNRVCEWYVKGNEKYETTAVPTQIVYPEIRSIVEQAKSLSKRAKAMPYIVKKAINNTPINILCVLYVIYSHPNNSNVAPIEETLKPARQNTKSSSTTVLEKKPQETSRRMR